MHNKPRLLLLFDALSAVGPYKRRAHCAYATMTVYNQEATLARAPTAFGDIETAIKELNALENEISKTKQKIDRRNEGSWWLNSLKDFARLLVAFFKGRVTETKNKILEELGQNAHALEIQATQMKTKADAAVRILEGCTEIINKALTEYMRIKRKTDS